MNENHNTFNLAITITIGVLFATVIALVIIREVKKSRNNILSDELENPKRDDKYTVPFV